MRMIVILAALLTLASPARAKDPKDRMWMALTTVQCGGVSVVIWREVDDPTDYYGTTEYAWDRDDASSGRFPRVQGFVYDDTGEAFLNGKQCSGVREELRGIKIRNIKIRNPRSRDDAAGQWCLLRSESTYMAYFERRNCKDSDGWLVLHPNGNYEAHEESCKVIRKRRGGWTDYRCTFEDRSKGIRSFKWGLDKETGLLSRVRWQRE